MFSIKKSGREKLVSLLFIFFAVWAVYLNAVDNEFHFDDAHSISANRSIRSLDNIPSFFSDPTTFSDLPWMAMYRPMLVVTYAVNYALSGPGETGFNIGNILIHSVNTLLIFTLLVRSYSGLVPLIASLFFGLAPICTQAVNYKSSRSVLLVAFFVLLSFKFYKAFLEKREKGSQFKPFVPYACSLLFYSLGLLSKEITITFPLTLFAYDYLFHKQGASFKVFFYGVFVRHMPFWIVSGLYLGLRKSFFQVSTLAVNKQTLLVGTATQSRTILNNIATQAMSNFVYLRETFVPYGLSVIHDFEDATGFFDPRVLAAVLFFLVFLFALARFRRKKPFLLFGALWFLISLAPETIIPLNIKVNESRAYFPAIGLTFCVAAFSQFAFLRYKKTAVWFFSAYLLMSAVVSFNRNMVWHDGWSLWTDTAKKAPNSTRVFFNLGSLSNTKKNYDEALRFLDKSISLNPLFHRPHNLRGVILFKLGKLEEAIESLNMAIKLAPKDGTTYYNLGIAYARLNNPEKAATLFKKALKKKPDFVPAIIGVGRLLEMNGDIQGAMFRYKEALGLDPENGEARSRLTSLKTRL